MQVLPSEEKSTKELLPRSQASDTKAQDATEKPVQEQPDDAAEKKRIAKEKAAAIKRQEKESLRMILGYMTKRLCSIIFAIFLLIGGQLSDFFVPLFMGRVINLLLVGKYAEVGTLCWQIFIIIVISGVFVGGRAIIFNTVSERIALDLRHDFYESIINKDVGFFDTHRTGEIISRLNSDIGVVQSAMSTNVSVFGRAAVFIVTAMAVMFYISWSLTLITFIAIIPSVCFAIFFGRKMRTLQRNILKEKARMNEVAAEAFRNVRTVKAFANEEEEARKFKKGNIQVYDMGRKKAIFQGIYSSLVQVFLYGAMAGVIYTAKEIVRKSTTQTLVSPGTITTFLFYLFQLVFNFQMISSVLNNVMGILGASDKIASLMLQEPQVKSSGGVVLEDHETKGRFEIKDLKFNYPAKKEVEVLKGVSIETNNEDKRVVALCGSSGCGKSSIIQLMQRFYDPSEGQILFNGHDIRDFDLEWYHKQVGLVSQEPVLFSGTVRDNILYGLDVKSKTETEIVEMLDEAAKMSSAYEFIYNEELFPSGYQTVVGERGVKLSGGQKQRIAIARALVRKPKVLLLDEATSALDAESEHQVQQALDKLINEGSQTVVVVAHRLSTIRHADEIIVMQKGEVKERGKHEELIELDGVYKNLVNRQLVSEQLQKEEKEENEIQENGIEDKQN